MLPSTSAIVCYLPDLVLRRFAADPTPIVAPEAARFEAAVLFADISGFTRLTERLAQRGPVGAEQLSALLNPYFEQLITRITHRGGDVVKFAGDALLAVWPTAALGEDLTTLTHRVAPQCGLEIQTALRGYQAAEGVTLSLKMGIGAGELVAMHLGGVFDRWELLLTGEPLEQVDVAEHHARPGDVVLSPAAGALAGVAFRGVPTEQGCVRLEAVSHPLLPRPAVLPVPDGEAAAALHAYLPGAIRARLAAGQGGWLAELRRVTVLFINLPGLNRSAADAVEATQRTVRALQTALYRFEGSLNKLSVDEKGVTLVAALGLPPLTHEDDAERGVLAAQAMQAELRALGVRSAIGVTTGRVYCGEIGSARRREYTIMGDAVNLAARLMQAAPDGLICDATTYQAARRRFLFETLPPLTVKGKAEPVAAYRPMGQAAASGATGALFGRAAERADLTERLTALEAGEGGVVVIQGEAGIGKSRLLADLAEQGRSRGMTVLLGAGDAVERTTPYHAWRPVFAQRLGVEGLTDSQQRRARVLGVLQAEPELLRLAPLLNGVLPLDLPDDELTSQMTGQVRADNTHELLLGLLQITVRQHATVLLLEDAHWFDSASWALTALVAGRVGPLLLVITTRPPAEPVPVEYQRLLDIRGARRLQLEALPPEDTLALVCQRLGVGSLPDSLAELIWGKAQGNPFFSAELAYALREAGLIEVEEGRCQVAPGADLDATVFPDNVQGVITSRLDRLSPPQQLAMKVASVIGRVFTFRTLRDVFPLETERDCLADHLTTLERLTLTQLETPDPNLAYLFKHVLIQEAAYGLLLFAQRRELHRAIAEWYERTFGEDPAPCYPLLAYHWGKAEVAPKAIDYLEKAGEQAMREGAYREALASFRQAVRLDDAAGSQGRPPASTLQRARWHRQIGVACVGLGQMEEARRHLESAVELLGHPVPQSPWRFASGLLRQVLVQALRRVFSRGIPSRASDPSDPMLEAAIAYCSLTEVYYLAYDPWLTVFASMCALNLSERAGFSAVLARSYGVMGFAAAHIPLHHLAAFYTRLAVRTARAIKDQATLAWVMVCNATCSMLAGDWEEVEREVREGLENADGVGDRRRGVELTMLLSCATGWQAAFQRSIQLARDCHARACRSDDTQGQGWGLYLEAVALLRLGRLEEVLSLLASPLLAQDLRYFMAGLLAVTRLWRGETEAARTAAAAAVKYMEGRRPTRLGALEPVAGPAEVYLALWEAGSAPAAEARQLKADALRACAALWRHARVFQDARPRAWLWQGLAYWLSGRPSRAQRAWRRSLEEAKRLRMPFEQGLAHYEIGRHLSAAEPSRQTHLRLACEIFTRLGAAYHLSCVQKMMDG